MSLDQDQFELALKACASEPIHLIGQLQPHGGLLAFSANAPHQVLQASCNIGEFTGAACQDVLNRPLADLFDPPSLSQIHALIDALPGQSTITGTLNSKVNGTNLALITHLYQTDGTYVLEMERDQGDRQEARLAELLLQTQQTMLRTDAYFETGRYFELLVELVRALTGYDSVMVYRFDPDWNGEVIAQSQCDNAPSYLGMHFPASDIPVQARRLYTTNLVRVIADVNASPVPIAPDRNALTGQPLDLTYSALRSLSPIHIEYLRNIGVHASMVISLMQDGRLWGLIACHHLSPKPASMGLREAAIFISHLISTRLSTLEAIEQRSLTDRANQIIGNLLKALPLSSVNEILVALMPELQKLLSANGMIIRIEGETHTCGETPPQDQIEVLYQWLAQNPKTEIFSSDYLGKACPQLAGCADTMAGILATPPTPDMRNSIIWVRKEKLRTINWAGKYEEGFVQNAAGNYRLTPRKSFELWSEAWSGRSDPWTPVEIGVSTMLALAVPESLAKKRSLEEALRLQQKTENELRMHRDHLETLVRDRTLALSIAKEAAESANRAKTVFLSTVSHELRTPMNGVMGLTSLATRRTEDPKLLDYLGKIEDSSKRLLSIINHMIDISDLESEKLTLTPVEFVLDEIIEESRHLVAEAAARKNLNLRFEMPPDSEHCRLLGDRDRLEQILLVLLENAIKFTTAGSVTTRVELIPDPTGLAQLTIEVQDTGIGIPKESRARLFSAFEQGDNSSTRRFGGAGLGLVICKRLIKMMDGEIGVDSHEGLGSTFWIRLRLPIVRHSTPATNQ